MESSLNYETKTFEGYTFIELDANLNRISSSNSYYAIITVLSSIGSIHLSRIAYLIGKSKSTTLGHLDNLVKEYFDNELNVTIRPFIEIDAEKILSTRGSKKYYKLSAFGFIAMKYQMLKLKDQQNDDSFDIDIENLESVTTEEFRNMAINEAKMLIKKYGKETLYNVFTIGGQLNSNIEVLATQQYLEFAQMASEGKDLSNIKLGKGTFVSHPMQVKISKLSHFIRLKTEISQLAEKLEQLKNEIESEIENDLTKGKIKEDDIDIQHIYLSMAPIFKE
ncbi:MAG: hypothetical protein INQ03_20435 [Candidatus Heimdallarchaeota archaeon]|nr:hypothetical protein [Candidatus Heimdallarchaeota archaeon]